MAAGQAESAIQNPCSRQTSALHQNNPYPKSTNFWYKVNNPRYFEINFISRRILFFLWTRRKKILSSQQSITKLWNNPNLIDTTTD